MSYLVLARKWRPRRFAELVGQEHVVRALSNALDSGRVHHAFLFTGTRGVGKTTIARIFAKSLNCERGVGAEPCGVCAVCEAVDTGRFVDLLEIDAASNTGVDDVREVIENAQYLPTSGRYKVYLIDEVHMLSKNAFNALLKTLEEPPEHVKFLLATTDPQKLPVTVLSRCLQFNLKRLTEEQIGGQMTHILAAEGIEADTGSIALLARGADGSLRDGLSLLDQALAFCGGALRETEVRTMLGTVDRAHVGDVLKALAANDGQGLLDAMGTIATFAPDYGAALDEVAQALHRVQLLQLVPGAQVRDERIDLASLAAAVPAELVQVWYQMAVNGRRDLYIAPSERVGFEMTLLRMLAFRPVQSPGASPQVKSAPAMPAALMDRSPGSTNSPRTVAEAPRPAATATQNVFDDRDTASAGASRTLRAFGPAKTARPAQETAADLATPEFAATAHAERSEPFAVRPVDTAPGELPVNNPLRGPQAESPAINSVPSAPGESLAAGLVGGEPVEPHAIPARESARLIDSDDWLDLLERAGLKGPVRELAANAAFASYTGVVLKLALPDTLEHFRTDNLVRQLAGALGEHLGAAPRIEFVAPRADGGAETLHDRKSRERSQKQADAEAAFMNDASVQRLVSQYGAHVQADAIRPLDDH